MADTDPILDAVQLVLSKHVLCDHCLGRQFAMLGTTMDNGIRGWLIRNMALLVVHARVKETGSEPGISFLRAQASTGVPLASSILAGLGISDNADRTPGHDPSEPASVLETRSCVLCEGIFSTAARDRIVSDLHKVLAQIEFNTFLVGSKIPPRLLEREETLRVEAGLKWGEAMKSHLNRFIGKEASLRMGKEVDFKAPDLVVVLTPRDADDVSITITVNPYFMYGKYKKLVRGIPQTHWPHRACRGRGCDACDHTGKQYKESVEEIIAGPILEATGGTAMKFHGAGREDIDALMLGEGRPFVVEIINGKHRAIDHAGLQASINARAAGKVEITGLRASTKEEMQALKSDATTTRKTYRATCSLERPLDDPMLGTIKTALEDAVVEQRTPVRVAHRRADKVRRKHVFSVSWEPVPTDPLKITFIIEAEGGTYIKELISSDGGRTVPSITSVAGQQVTCVELDVVDVKDAGA